jgi:hypothetical protein
VGGSSKAPGVSKLEKQLLDTPESPIQDPEDPASQQNDPPPQTDAATFEPMNTDVNPVHSHDAPSPKPTSRAQSIEEIPLEKNSNNIAITKMAYTAPGVSTVLDKHSTKEESPSLEKGKAKLDLESYSSFNTSEVYVGYLSRLHTSRDMEAGLVHLMKQKYEV